MCVCVFYVGVCGALGVWALHRLCVCVWGGGGLYVWCL